MSLHLVAIHRHAITCRCLRLGLLNVFKYADFDIDLYVSAAIGCTVFERQLITVVAGIIAVLTHFELSLSEHGLHVRRVNENVRLL